ncbi:caffeic acid 3-O-methyltransferase-like [Bidens hawaiensis]|uniref:caffeic acid 3-O-methyltransferase-like n=1 Tax=Bidens hawaiensis TaxID=980011 RepID=UPI00404ACD3C
MDTIGDIEAEYTYAMQLATSITLPMVLSNAIKLKVLETIAEGGPGAKLSAQEIAIRLSVSNDDAPNKLDRMLQLLASYSVVTCTQVEHDSKPVRAYGLAPVAKHFIPNEDGASLSPMMDLLQDQVTIKSWFKLKDSVVDGGTPVEKVTGMKGYEYMASDPRFTEVFNKAMKDTSAILIKEILKDYDGFNNLKTLVDVGGGLGGNLYMIVSKHKEIKGINFDLPTMISRAPQFPGVEHVAGDMFDGVPKGDAIFLKWIVHGWGDDECIKLLKNCHTALPDDGKVIIVDKIVPFLPDTSSITKADTHLDALMLTLTYGGKERTEEEFLTLAIDSGFSSMRKKCFKCTFWVIEFYK